MSKHQVEALALGLGYEKGIFGAARWWLLGGLYGKRGGAGRSVFQPSHRRSAAYRARFVIAREDLSSDGRSRSWVNRASPAKPARMSGTKLQVRFCEEPGTNRRMAEIGWHRRQTRRTQRKQTYAETVARTRHTLRMRSPLDVTSVGSPANCRHLSTKHQRLLWPN